MARTVNGKGETEHATQRCALDVAVLLALEPEMQEAQKVPGRPVRSKKGSAFGMPAAATAKQSTSASAGAAEAAVEPSPLPLLLLHIGMLSSLGFSTNCGTNP